MEENLIDEHPASLRKRPRFLTVLCILTWIGSLLDIAQQAYLLTVLTDLSERFGSGFSFTHRYVILFFVACIASLACIAAGVLMWKLRRIGFTLYTIAQLLPILVDNLAFPGLGDMNWLYLTHSAVSLLFIILYSLNLKHLR
jgi:hypothetical protein